MHQKRLSSPESLKNLDELARNLADALLNDVPENCPNEDVHVFIDGHLPGLVGLLKDQATLSEFKQKICEYILQEREKSQRLDHAQQLVASAHEKIMTMVEEVVEANRTRDQVDLNADVDNVLMKYLNGFYHDPAMREELSALRSALRLAVRENVASIRLIYSEAEVAENVDAEYTKYIQSRPQKVPLYGVGISVLSLGVFRSFVPVVTNFVQEVSSVVSAGKSFAEVCSSLDALISKIDVVYVLFGVGCLYFVLKLYNILVDKIQNGRNFRESADRMMKDFTYEANFKTMLACLEQSKYDSPERFLYKKELRQTIHSSLKKGEQFARQLAKITAELHKHKDKDLANTLTSYAQMHFPIDVQDSIAKVIAQEENINQLREAIRKELEHWRDANVANTKHLRDLEKIFLPYMKADARKYPWRIRVENKIANLFESLLASRRAANTAKKS